MGIGPLEKWRPKTVGSIEDVRETLHELERILKLYAYFLETDSKVKLTVREEDGVPTVINVDTIRVSNGTLTNNGGGSVSIDIAAGSAPIGAEYVVAVSDATLTNERVLQNGTNTTVSTGAGTIQVNVASAPPSGTAGGDLAGTYPNPEVDGIRNRAISNTPTANGQLLINDQTNSQWDISTLTAGEGIDITNGAGSITVIGEDASTTNRGIVQLTNHLGGTATAPTVRSATTGQTGIVQLANDLAGTATAPVVAGIRGVTVDVATPTAGDILRHNGGEWAVVPEEIVFMPTDFFLSSNAALLTGTVTNGWLRIEFADATTPDPFAWASTRFRDEWYDTDLHLQVAFRGTGTGGNMRTWWNLADAGTGIDGTANAVTLAISANAKTVHTLSTTVNISSAAGARNVTLMVGRDAGNVLDTINDTVDFLFARVFPT